MAVTGLGAGDSRGHGGFLYDAIMFPLVLKRVYDDKDVQEQMIRASGLDVDHRPPRAADQRAGDRPRCACWPIPRTGGPAPSRRADVADFLVREAFERRFVGQTPLLIQ